MTAVMPFLEASPTERGKNRDVLDGIEEGIAELQLTEADLKSTLKGLGEAPDVKLDADGSPVDPLARPHTELSRLLWARTLIAKALVGAKFKLGLSGNQLNIEVVPADPAMREPVDPENPKTTGLKRNVLPWHWSSVASRGFKLFSTNSKMRCPTFDLPAGMALLGGACPGATYAQSTVPETVLKTVTDRNAPNYGDVLYVQTPRDPSKVVKRTALEFLIGDVQKDWRHLPRSERPAPALNLKSTVCTYCIAGDTLVMVRGYGLMRIEDCVRLGKFEVWSGQGWRLTEAAFMKLASTVEVTFAGGRKLRCTPDHRIMTTDGEVEAAQLIPGEHCIDPQLPTEVAFPAMAVLPEVARTAQHCNERRGELPTMWSREVGVWLGYLVGDGWFVQSQKYPTLGVCSGAADAGDLKKLAQLVAPWAGGVAEVTTHETPKSAYSKNGGEGARVYWRRKDLVAFVRSLGLDKSGELRTPAAVWQASADGVRGYLSGLFSTDGSVARWPQRVGVSFANTSKVLCEEVQQLLFTFGIRSNICEYTSNARRGHKRCWKVDIASHDCVRRFEQEIGFFNERKAASLRAGLEAAGERKMSRKTIAVESVEHDEKLVPVYDLLNVGEEQQFLANGIPVHNCYATGGKYGEAVVQFAEVARMAFVRALVNTPEGRDVLHRLLVRAIEETLIWDEETTQRHGVRPIRVHSSGDFFNETYADVWLKVARTLHINHIKRTAQGIKEPRIVLWAPTRTHTLPAFNRFWRERFASGAIPPNFLIRPSAYSVGDPAPYIKRHSPTGTKGTSVLFEDDARARVLRKHGAEFGDGSKFDFQCGVYALDKGNKTCLSSKAPDGKIGCRACWTRPDLAVNYVVH